jgi:DNA-binding NtrC family response regulator
MRELLGQYFRQWAYTTVTAGTLGEARKAVLTQGPFKMVVCDFDLPDGNGLQFFSWLRWEQQNHARFLLMSGSTNFVRYCSPDFTFLPKPFRSEQLHSRVVEMIGTGPQAG